MARPLQYSWKFMAKAIGALQVMGNVNQVALVYGIAPRTLERWKKRYDRDAKFQRRIDEALD